jgi:hypothetical protein
LLTVIGISSVYAQAPAEGQEGTSPSDPDVDAAEELVRELRDEVAAEEWVREFREFREFREEREPPASCEEIDIRFFGLVRLIRCATPSNDPSDSGDSRDALEDSPDDDTNPSDE